MLFKTNSEDVKDSTKLKGAVSFLSDNYSGSDYLYAIDNNGKLVYLDTASHWFTSIDDAVMNFCLEKWIIQYFVLVIKMMLFLPYQTGVILKRYGMVAAVVIAAYSD